MKNSASNQEFTEAQIDVMVSIIGETEKSDSTEYSNSDFSETYMKVTYPEEGQTVEVYGFVFNGKVYCGAKQFFADETKKDSIMLSEEIEDDYEWLKEKE